MKNKKSCTNCKHYPVGNHWPCVDCDMLFHDRWEKPGNNSPKIKKGEVGMENSIDDAYKSDIDDAYKRGAEDAWEAARKIVLDNGDGWLSIHELCNIFGSSCYSTILKDNSPLEAIEKIRQYEKRNEFQVGDEVTNGTDTGVVTKIGNTDFALIVLLSDGVVDIYNPMDWKKTGRHFSQIVDVLEMMNKEE